MLNPITVSLPKVEFIDCSLLTRCIALALYPTMETCEGIDCVIAKVGTSKAANSTSGLTLQTALTQGDREILERLLTGLPKVFGWMSDYELAIFMYQYSILPNRPDWDPVLVNLAHIWKMEAEQLNAASEHRKKLQDKLFNKQIQAFDAAHLPANKIGPGVYIRREQALQYITECGLVEDIDRPFRPENLRVFTASSGRRVAGFFRPPKISPNLEGVPKTKGTGMRWTPEAVARLIEYLTNHSVKDAAKCFEVSEQRIRIVKKKYQNNSSGSATNVQKIASGMYSQLVVKGKG